LKNLKTTDSISSLERFFVYLTCIYILTWYLQVGNRIEFLGTIRFEFLLGSFLSACALFKFISSPEKTSPIFAPALFFLGVMSLYTLFSYDIAYSWQVFFNRVIKFCMLAVFFSAFIRTPWALKMAVGAFLLAMLKLGQEGFLGWYLGGLVWESQGILRLHGSVPLYAHPNSFSGLAVGCLPFIYYLFPTVSKLWKGFLILLLIFCVVIIVFTGSRTGYVATLGLCMVFFIKSHGMARWRYLFLAFLMSVGAVFAAPADYVERFQSIYTLQEKEGASAETRLEILDDAVNVYLAYPLGVGVGAFPLVRNEMFGRSQDTHNLYFELLTNLGPLGLIAFFVLIFRLLRTNREIQKQLASMEFHDKPYILAISHAIVAFIYARLILGLFGMDAYEIYWWFAIGITVALWAIVQGLAQKQDPKVSHDQAFLKTDG
jgi:putative inorganic carbon (hco3(-)) transporter